MFLTTFPRLWRRLTRETSRPAVICWACYARSENHPSGPLRRYTAGRLGGVPICERHSDAEISELRK